MEYLLLALPAIAFFIMFRYLPMAGAVLAFKDFRYNLGIFRSPWIGFKNFEFFVTSQDFAKLMRNTIGYGLVFMVTGLITAVGLSLLMFEVRIRSAVKFFQTVMIFPRFLSWVIVGFVTYLVFSHSYGIANRILAALGAETIDWYTQPKAWPFILTGVNIWKGVGTGAIMYYAALMGVNKELYEAAEIDGAGRWKQTLHISLPALIPLMVVLTILAIQQIVRGDFGLFFQIPRDIGALYNTTDIMDTYVFRGLREGDMAITAAVGLFQSVAAFILIVGTNLTVRKISPEHALF
ncbi:MAG: sugar ABC transporter permease [Spirochaetales bacterium]|nr:sugar ABC transporter permease [Spirochaetales bacterium]